MSESKKEICEEYRVHFSMQMKENKKNKVPQKYTFIELTHNGTE